jgi:hypothetical protein
MKILKTGRVCGGIQTLDLRFISQVFYRHANGAQTGSKLKMIFIVPLNKLENVAKYRNDKIE